MLSKTALSTLASVGRLASNDITPRPLVLQQNDGKLRAIYRGAYTVGELQTDVDGDVLPGPTAVGAQQFFELAKLFEEGASLAVKGDSLELYDDGCRVSLQCSAQTVPYDPTTGEKVLEATVDGAKLRDELSLAAGFCSKDTTMPILTGVRLIIDGKGTLAISSSDGSSGLFQSSIPCACNDGADATVVGRDATTALTLLLDAQEGEGEVTVNMRQADDGSIGVVGFSTKNGMMWVSTLFGKWPPLERITATSMEGEPLPLPEAAIERVLAGVRVLKAPPNVTIRGLGDGRLELATEASETGSVKVTILGEIPTGVVTLGSDALERASLIAKEPRFTIPADEKLPVLIRDEGVRYYWAQRKYSAKQ